MFYVKKEKTDIFMCAFWNSNALKDSNSLWPSDAIWVKIGLGNGLLQTNVDLSSVRSKDTHLEEISWEMSQPSIAKMNLKTT